jgi:hypothetical protein
MAVPTLTSITPRRGASDGSTLVEVRGSGFRVPTASDVGPTVRVLVGGRRASHVLVYAGDELTCLTPVGDPFDAVAVGTFAAGVFSSAGHAVAEGARLRFDRGAPAPLLAPDDPAAVPYFAYQVVAGVSFKVSLSPSAGPAVAVAAGAATARTEGAADVVVQNLAAGEPVAGETATLAAGFQFLRPDLSVPGALVRLKEALVRDLKRIHPNVSVTTSVDYDAQTGDVVMLQPVAGLPALILSDMRLRENRVRHLDGKWEKTVGDGTRFVERRPRTVYDVRSLLVAVTDNGDELVNLQEALTHHFKKTPKLYVRRSAASALDDEVGYDMHAAFAEVGVDVQGGSASGIESLGMEIVVVGVVLEASEGMPQDPVPGMPASLHNEATVAFGYTLETPELTFEEREP